MGEDNRPRVTKPFVREVATCVKTAAKKMISANMRRKINRACPFSALACIKENVYKLYDQEKDIDLLINNAGFGLYGRFVETDLEKEINMINTNIIALHILTKLYLKEMIKKDSGQILNVASIAGFMPGPLMATYYASKNYVVSFSRAIRKELKKEKSNVKISVLCPGPVNTNFNNVANVNFSMKGLSSEYVAKYSIEKMGKGKFIIVPGSTIRLARAFSEITPDVIKEEMAYYAQTKKR